jgi:hypothetical protein
MKIVESLHYAIFTTATRIVCTGVGSTRKLCMSLSTMDCADHILGTNRLVWTTTTIPAGMCPTNNKTLYQRRMLTLREQRSTYIGQQQLVPLSHDTKGLIQDSKFECSLRSNDGFLTVRTLYNNRLDHPNMCGCC